jgi:integrase
MLINNYTTRTYIKESGLVMIRIRWNAKKSEISLSLGYKVEPEKWDSSKQLVKANTTLKNGKKIIYAKEINTAIRNTLSIISEAFDDFNRLSIVPDKNELKNKLSENLNYYSCKGSSSDNKNNDCLFEDAFAFFMMERPKEGSFGSTTPHKYKQMHDQVLSCRMGLTLLQIDQKFMNRLVVWYVDNDYCNRTINKQIKMLKSCLRWLGRNGYPINKEALEFKPKLKVIPKTVTYLKYNELIHFMNYTFPENQAYLTKARDLFCFMCFTSLRYSDLVALKHSHIIDEQIEMFSEKTDGKLIIPLVDQAKQIIEKYSWYKGDTVFPVPSNQKLNDYLKEAAELAGLNRIVSQSYFKGNERYEKTAYFYEQISCHDARRTFVVCSLSLGIPMTIVMRATGHSDYESMKPYIEVLNETQRMEMDKWNTHQYKSRIIEELDKMDSEQLKKLFEYVKEIA